MRSYVQRCSSMSRLLSIGQSVEGRTLWALEISNKAGLQEPKPSFKYVANMHGDEPSGRFDTDNLPTDSLLIYSVS